jgi:hypothetical protein
MDLAVNKGLEFLYPIQDGLDLHLVVAPERFCVETSSFQRLPRDALLSTHPASSYVVTHKFSWGAKKIRVDIDPYLIAVMA